MAAKDHDHNLLFGILAVQLDFISRDALVAAMNAWVLAKDKPLGEILMEQKALAADSRDLLGALVQKHLAMHENDPEKSLAAISSLGPVREDLLELADPDVQASLVHVSAAHSPDDPGTTQTFAVGSATSAGTRFRILRPHAEGALGRVSVARDEELHREVALKEIKERHADDAESRARFLLEAEITGGLEHPGIVPIYGLGQYSDGRPYYAMRFIRGDSLKEAASGFHHARAGNSTPGDRVVELRKLLARFLDVCNAIAYAHSRGVLHRDLKPGNIMLGKYGETLVVDWGLAKVMDRPEVKTDFSQGPIKPSSGSGSAATQMGAALGTPQYMSPEQAAGRLDLLGPASDVYGLGATLYYVLTGQRPIDSDDVATVLKMVERGEVRPPRAVNPEITRPLEAICLKAMALNPGDRYPSPKALADEIERWLADEPVTAYREPCQARATRWGRKHKTIVAGCFGLVTAAAIALAISTTLIQRAFVSESAARNQAQTERARAEENAHNAQEQTQQAEKEKRKAQRQLASSCIERGVNELEHGEAARGFAILGQAYRAAIEADDAGLRRSVCALLGAWRSTLGLRLVHDSAATAVAFSPDGMRLATASLDKTARLWDAATGQPLGTPMAHDYVVGAVAFSPDGSKLATASLDKTARLWDAATGQQLGAPLKHEAGVDAVAFSPDGTKLVTASRDARVRLWDAATGKPRGPPMNLGFVSVVAFSPDGTKLATASLDKTARLWDAATGKQLSAPLKHEGPVCAVAFSPDGTRLATASWDKTARLWDAATGKQLGAPMKHDGSVWTVAFSPDGTRLATASFDKTTRLWDAATGQPLGAPMKHDGSVLAVAFSPDGTKLATASGDKTARLWDAATSRQLGAPLKHEDGVLAVAFNPDGTKIATVDYMMARLWDTVTYQSPSLLLKYNNLVWAAAFSPDGTKLATASEDRTAQLWDAATGRLLDTLMTHEEVVTAVACSLDGRKLATASLNKTTRLWDTTTGQPLGATMKHDDRVGAMAFSPDGTKLATASDDTTARLWDAATGQPLGKPMKHDGSVTAVAFSPDGTRLATASSDKTARLWDAATGKQLGAPLKHDDGVLAVAFNPDGTKLATACADKTARLWDAATGKQLGAPLKHEGKVNAVAFSPDGTKLATASDDKTARLWDAATGQPLGSPMEQDDRVLAVTFSPDGTTLAAAIWDRIGLWAVPRSLSDDQRCVTAYVDVISAWKEDADAALHRISVRQADDAWREVLKSPAWLDTCRQDAERRDRTWHENEADAHEAANNWFAAAFHLRCLCRLEPKNTQWQQRLVEAKGYLAGPALGPPRLLAKDAQAGTWSPDGTKIAFTNAKPFNFINGIRILTLASNTIEELTRTGKDPAWSPGDGRFIALTDKKAGDKEEGIWITDLRSKQIKRVATGEFAYWLADGKTVCYRTSIDGKLALQSLDVTDDKATPKTLLTGVWSYPAISPDGQYVAGFDNSELQIWSVARQEIVDRHPLPAWRGFLPSWSPDSRQVGFGSFAQGVSNGLWIYDLRTHQAKKLLAGPYTLPRWCADGKRMCVDERGSGPSELWLLDLQAAPAPERK